MITTDQSLNSIFGSKSRTALFKHLFTNPSESHRIGEMVTATNINQRLISTEITKLTNLGIVLVQKTHNTRTYHLNPNHDLFHPLSLIFAQEPWSQWERPARIHHLLITLESGLKPMHEYYGYNLSQAHLIFQYDNVTWFYKKNEFAEAGKNLIPIYQKNKRSIWNDFNRFSKALFNHKNYANFYDNYVNFWKVAYITELISFYIDSLLALDEHIYMKHPSFTDEYETLLNKTALKAKVCGIEKVDISPILKSYSWINNSYHSARRLTESEARAEVEKRMKHTHHPQQKKQTKIDSITLELQKIGADMIYMQDLRKKITMMAADKIHFFLKEIGNNYGIKPTEMAYTLPAEILTPNKLSNIKEELILRERACTITGSLENGIKIFSGQIILPQGNQKSSILEIRGRVACGGKAIGRAKIIHKASDIGIVNHGDIIVAPMTSPEMTPAIRRSVAIVTNEGGITCHAAVIAREFNIPCITATGNATELIHDKDMIEVDGDAGLVKIIEKVT